MPPTYAYGKLCMNALVNFHLEQCRDYAGTRNRIKHVIRAIRTYYSLNCSGGCAIINSISRNLKKQLPCTYIWTNLTEFVFLMILKTFRFKNLCLNA